MKKILYLIVSLLLFAFPFNFCVSAAELTDGIYEVPVTLMHKEDEKESFGNKYVAQVALLKVQGDEKTVTILLTTDMKGIEFSYYINGSVDGDAEECNSVSNVTVAGETYEQGFEIPVMADGDIGLQFSVPVMPMSPSARLRIDYDNAVLVPSAEVTTTGQITEPSTTAEATSAAIVTETTTTTTTQEAVVTTAAPVTETSVAATVTAVPESLVTQAETADDEEGGIPSIVFVLLFIIGAVGMVLLLTGDSKEENKNDDK